MGRGLANVLDLTPEEFRRQVASFGLEPFRADQVLDWVYKKGVTDFDRMTNLSADLRRKLKGHFSLTLPRVIERRRSGEDGSFKLLLGLPKGDSVETVYMSAKGRETVCVSTQVGCKFHCAFCASGQNGFFRNLKAGEIVSQVLLARELSPQKRVSHVVFMGIGEPFDNYAELLKAIRTLNSPKTLGLGARKMTVSTSGLVPKIRDFANEGLQVELSVSLHGPSDRVRGAIMPVNRAWPVKPLIEACREYVKKTKRAITFEYILVKGVNASEKEARELVKLLSAKGGSASGGKGLLCKVNLIPYNPIKEFPHDPPAYSEIVRFQKVLQAGGVATTVRFSKGRDIQAACGQLRSVKLRGQTPLAPEGARGV